MNSRDATPYSVVVISLLSPSVQRQTIIVINSNTSHRNTNAFQRQSKSAARYYPEYLAMTMTRRSMMNALADSSQHGPKYCGDSTCPLFNLQGILQELPDIIHCLDANNSMDGLMMISL